MIEPDFVRATRTFYDTVAAEYAARFRDELAAKPLDRGLLGVVAELIRAHDAGPVADLGCGPGNVTALLHSLGVPAFGIDLSPEMVALARKTHPGLRFDQGSMLELDLADGSLGGVVAWYSTVHTPQERLPELFAELRRVLAPGGHVLLAFQVGEKPLHVADAFGHPVSLDFLRRDPQLVVELLEQAGFTMQAQLLREPDRWERSRQAFLLARTVPLSVADDAVDQGTDTAAPSK